jgi:aminoglycoside phosphotransferase family enzyme
LQRLLRLIDAAQHEKGKKARSGNIMKPGLNQDLEAKVRFLASAGGLVPGETPIARETHMSWVFLTQQLVFKLKKPVRHSFLDFSTRELREAACREELRINQVLAPGVYLRLARLTRNAEGSFALDGAGPAEDWLVVMQRLDTRLMLDKRLSEGPALRPAIEGLADLLMRFYASASPDALTPDSYSDRFRGQFAEDRSVISQPCFRIDHQRAAAVLDRLDSQLRALGGALCDRIASGCVIEGHGDLRPEHVWLGEPVRIIDRLEFNRNLRLVDPFDELAFLGMECAVAGVDWIGPLLIRSARSALRKPAPSELVQFYHASRAVLRARLSLAHLFDETPRDPERWEPQAERYLDQAACALNVPRRSTR